MVIPAMPPVDLLLGHVAAFALGVLVGIFVNVYRIVSKEIFRIQAERFAQDMELRQRREHDARMDIFLQERATERIASLMASTEVEVAQGVIRAFSRFAVYADDSSSAHVPEDRIESFGAAVAVILEETHRQARAEAEREGFTT